MTKRVLDIIAALIGLFITAPILAVVLFTVWLTDRHNPFYPAMRTGRYGGQFRMLKVRSMVIDADKSKVWATATDDQRITAVGRVIRACKLDELLQLWNVLVGEMSFVGPRPLAPDETCVYTDMEKTLLSVRPGITDIASIVFADEGELLAGCSDPTVEYDRLIRPWKSRFSLLYIHRRSIWLDIKIILITLTTIANRRLGLRMLQRLLRSIGAYDALLGVASRKEAIPLVPPPGASASSAHSAEYVTSA